MSLFTYTNEDFLNSSFLLKEIKKNGYSKIKVYRAHNHKGIKPVLRCGVHFKVFSDFISGVNSDLEKLLNDSPISVKAAYLRGYASAEGCASHAKSGARFVTICQNNRKELAFIKSLLKEVGIERIDGPRWTGTAFRIATSNADDLERFQQRIGFGAHEAKNEKLRHMLESYKQRRWYVNGRYKIKI